jgi:hypothetical protein
MPGANQADNGAPTLPPAKWADSWGAIAIDFATGSAGTVTDRQSKSQAISDAMRDCESKGSTACKVAASYYNQCAAVAWSEKSYGVSTNPAESDAQQHAMKTCERYGTDCKIVYSACSVARRVN